MALSRKLTKEKTAPPSVEELIMKGGSSGAGQQESSVQDDDKIRMVQLRMPIGDVNLIDKARKKRPGKVSRHTWIIEAIEEKLARENGGV
jgi:hypothetical protein